MTNTTNYFEIPETKKIIREDLVPTELVMSQLACQPDCNQDALIELFNKKNRVAIGEPISQKIASDESYDYYIVKLYCTFEADKGCHFTEGKFNVELTSEDNAIKPIAWDIFPKKIEDAIKVEKKLSHDASFKFSFSPIEANTSVGDGIIEKYITYSPIIQGSGSMTRRVAWKFKVSKSHPEIYGDENLLLMLRTPKDTNPKCNIYFGGEVYWCEKNIPIARKTDINAAQLVYNLT